MSNKNKNKNNNNENNNKPKNNWKSFIITVLTSFFIILTVGLLGANVVYYTRINLDMIFPTDIDQRPYTDESNNGTKLPPLFPSRTKTDNSAASQSGGKKMKGGASSSSCGAPIDFTQSEFFDNKYVRGMFDYGFPYSIESKENTFSANIKNWFPNKAKYSYRTLRIFIKQMLNVISSTCSLLPESMNDIVAFILGPIIISIIILVTSLWWLPTLVTTFLNENTKWGMFISILGLFFGWTWFTPVLLSFFQVIGVIFSFTLLPVILNAKQIMEIMGNKYNSYYLLLIFFIIAIVAAFSNLQTVVAVPMLLIFIIVGFMPPSNSSD